MNVAFLNPENLFTRRLHISFPNKGLYHTANEFVRYQNNLHSFTRKELEFVPQFPDLNKYSDNTTLTFHIFL